MRNLLLPLLIIATLGVGLIVAQDALPDTPDCDPATISDQLTTFNEILSTDFSDDPVAARDNLFRLGALYTDIALNCGYEPSEQEINGLIQQALSVADLSQIIAANAVGDDLEAILAEFDAVVGDSFNGQLLYNGIEDGLDGTGLGCAACHNGQVAPATEGTWTRVTEVRLEDPALEGYDVRRYLVESIVRPNDYLVPPYGEGLMSSNYGSRLDLQQLADLVAFLESQDQLLDE